MNITDKICCCTGHRPKGFVWDYYNKSDEKQQEYLQLLEYIIERDILQGGFNYFISGGAIGADMDFAETVIRLREKYSHIRLELAIPCANQDLKWRKDDKQRYQNILEKADIVNILYSTYTPWCMDRRNRYMVDKSEKILAIWNASEKSGTYNTIQYAYKKMKLRDFIMLPPLKLEDFQKQLDYYIEYGCSLKERKSKDEAIERCLKNIAKSFGF